MNNRIPEKLEVKATRDVTMYNYDMSEIVSEVKEGETFVSEITDTEEYMSHDSKGRRIFVAAADFYGRITYEDGYEPLNS